MATIKLSLSRKKDKITKFSEILIRFSGGRGRVFRLKSNIFVSESRWNTKEGKIILPRIDTKERRDLISLQSKLNLLSNEIIAASTARNFESQTSEYFDEVIERFHYPEKFENKEIAVPDFFENSEAFLDERKLSEVRKRNFKVLFRSLRRFEQYYRLSFADDFNLTFESLEKNVLLKFEDFLKNEYLHCEKPEFALIYDSIPEKRRPKMRGQNTINDLMTKLRTYFLWAIDNGLTNNNPFKKIRIEECVYSDPIYITIEEREKIYNTDFSESPELSIQKDIFVFQCLVGCRIGDLYNFSKENIINGQLQYIQGKTIDGHPRVISVPLHHTANEILERYADKNRKELLPLISKQEYNYAIKKIFAKAGVNRIITRRNPTTGKEEQISIDKIASSHMARKTFIGNLYKKVKDPNLVSSVSGHKEGSKAFARYRYIDEEMKKDLIELLD